MSPAHGWCGARATIQNVSFLPPEKICFVQQAGKAWRGSRGGNALPASHSRAERGLEWETARPCVSKETKPVKIVSLIEKEFCARPLKEKEILAGFVSAFGGASRWASLAREARRQFRSKKVRAKVNMSAQ